MARERNQLRREIEELRARLAEAEDTLRAIREGEVDAIVVSGPRGDQVFSLFGTESIYRLIVETMKEAAFTVAFDGKILYCNAQFSQFVKKQPEQIIGHTLEEFVSHDNRISMSSLLIAARKEPVKQRLVFRAGDGTTAPALISTNLLDQPDSMSICIVVSDLTELENSTELIQQLRDQKEALHESEERLRVATESAEAGMWSVHIPSNRWEFSPQAARLFGLSDSGPITLEQIRERTHPDDLDRLAEQSARSLAEPGLHELEYRVIHPDSSVHWVMLRGRTEHDDNGRPLRNMGVVLDITLRKQTEEALRESEQRFRLALKNSPVVVAMQDTKLVYQWAYNTRTNQPEDVVGKTDADLFAPEDLPSIMEAKRRVLQNGEVVRQEHWLTSNGQRIFLDCCYEPLRDSVTGNIIGIGIAAVNLTEQKQAEEALAMAHRQTQNIIDNTPAIVYAFDLEERFVMANTTVAELLNSTPEQMIGKRRHEFMPKEDADWHEANDRKAIEEGRALEFEERSQLKGRSIITWLTTKFPLRDAQGRIYAVAGISADISERKRAEEQLRENEERLRMVLENSRDGINMLDLKTGRYVYMSPAQVKLTGFSAEDLMDLSVEDAYGRVHPEDREISVNQQKQLAAGQEPGEPVEYRWKVKSGEYRWFSDSRSVIRDPQGKPMALVGICRDITDRKNFERQLQELNNTLEKQVEERTAELERRALQLRQLMAELTLAEQRERQHLSQVLHDGLQQILVAAKYQLALVPRSRNVAQSANQVEELIADAIETSRSLSAELSPPILFKEDLVSALEWLVRWMRDKHGLDVDLIARKKIEPFTQAVLILLFQSARELLFNVVKHAGVKKARIEIDRQDGRIQITIEDEGAGFDMNKLETGEAQRCGSIGLLSIRERLSHIGGSMEIDSAPGRGSRFRLIVPFSSIPEAPADNAQPKISVVISSGAQSVPATEGTIRIVLVDDHMVVRQGMASLLRCEPDFQIVGEASDGEAAINLVEEIQPDVVLMDISLPGMNGVQATRIVHEKFPEIRIIGLSMFQKGEQEKDMREAGAIHYMAKSDPSESLIQTIRACMKGKQRSISAS
jgi:PAS domain S-box-containing protein